MNDIKTQLDRIELYSRLAAKNVLELEEAALYTGISKTHFYKLTCRKEIPFYKQGKRCYFDKAELDSYLKQNRVLTNEEAEATAAAHNIKNHGRKTKKS